jgi:hypothetical protein
LSEKPTPVDKDRDICAVLGTNPTELERLVGKSRQTISKHIKNNEFFGLNEVMTVAAAKFPDDLERSQIISKLLKAFFPDVLLYAKDFDVLRFSQYYVFGMDVHHEIATNPAFEKFIVDALTDPKKFILFASAPVGPCSRMAAWLTRFQDTRGNDIASFILIPCKLTELTPVQVLADPWTNDPQIIQIDENHAHVDSQSSQRAGQIANALKQYGGRAARECASEEDAEARKRAAKQLMNQLNHSAYEGLDLPAEPVTFFNERRQTIER